MEANEKIAELLSKVREKSPLVHHITNYVTVNDCANITLAAGASPVMADDINEVSDMVSLASSLVINIGTLNSRSVESMIVAGKRANNLSIPVILDPVGAGATSYRTDVAKRIINEVDLAVVRGNLSEIKTLYGLESKTRGVDSIEEIDLNKDSFNNIKTIAKNLAIKLNTTVAITGRVDIITDGNKIYLAENGNELMSRVTGTGCMCTSLIGSYLGVGKDNLIAALSGVVSMGIAGEISYERLDKNYIGIGSLKTGIIDGVYSLSKEEILKRSRIYQE